MSEVHSQQAELRVVLFTSTGRNFSAGIDYAGFARMSEEEAGHIADMGYEAVGTTLKKCGIENRLTPRGEAE